MPGFIMIAGVPDKPVLACRWNSSQSHHKRSAGGRVNRDTLPAPVWL